MREELDPKNQLLLEHPQLLQVLDSILLEIAESIIFHANDLNQELYNHSWEIYKEKQIKLKLSQKQEEEKQRKSQGTDGKKSDYGLLNYNNMTLVNFGVFLGIALAMWLFGWNNGSSSGSSNFL